MLISRWKNLRQSLWGIFLDTLKALVDSWPWINQVHPPLTVPYAQLLRDVINNGQTFFVEFNKFQGDQCQDEIGMCVSLTVSGAIKGGSSRKIEGRSGNMPEGKTAPQNGWKSQKN